MDVQLHPLFSSGWKLAPMCTQSMCVCICYFIFLFANLACVSPFSDLPLVLETTETLSIENILKELS